MPSITYYQFQDVVKQAVERYLHVIADYIGQGWLQPAPGYVHLFPSTLLFTKTETHYVFELLGSRREQRSLLVKENARITSFNRLIGSFNPDPDTKYLFGPGVGMPVNTYPTFSNVVVASPFHIQQLEERFPGFASLAPPSQLLSFGTATSMLPIDAQYFRTLALNQCYLTSNLGNIIRPRYVNFLFAESKDADAQEFTEDFGRHMNIPSKGPNGGKGSS